LIPSQLPPGGARPCAGPPREGRQSTRACGKGGQEDTSARLRIVIRSGLSSYVLGKIERISFIKKYAQMACNMKTLIKIHKDGKYFVAIDLITNVGDQGLTESEAVSNLKKGLEEHYQVLLELAPKGRKLSFLDIEVEGLAQASGNLVQKGHQGLGEAWLQGLSPDRKPYSPLE